MLSPKVFYSAGKWFKAPSDILFLVLGSIGAVILVYCLSLSNPQMGYIFGSTLMLTMAIHYKLVYFISLEIILIAGHAAILLGIGPYLQITLPSLLCVQLIVYYAWTRQLKNIYLIIGIIGISLLSIGFAYDNEVIFLIGSTGIGIYSIDSAKNGVVPCYIWAILNIIFAITSLIKIML